ncbi:DHA2 family efflux MFS transporter permease subunit [Myxococcus xanthus]|uniref:DHA2 family efflux MFS transporter permease subunit n=1 Tax=Myxococcus xanthus TaxID=34 RepID=A0A7Y4MPB6_MYXXA|nr:DHA2 family efflux MFS transporter permease subunit [Myxococcus xanthus]NOJ77280.1 DHA2 family efflux MFS transporter permease subunit [Myxococcus xanthus]NOJ85519.1 DHA2 family efflux MFS transporter permease subunit [Myxococcus xanthus]
MSGFGLALQRLPSPMHSAAEPTVPRFWPLMFTLFVGSFMSVLSSSTITIAIPELQRHFGAELSSVQWTLTGFMLAMGTSAPLTGYLGGRFSFKWVYVASLVGFLAASVLCGVSWDTRALVAFRFVQGAFCGAIMPVTMTLIYQLLPRERQALAASLWALSSMLAPAFGPTLAGWLMTLGNWRWLFFMNVPLGLAAVAMAVRTVPYYRLEVPKAFDFPGLLTVITGTLALLIALSQGRAWGWTDAKTVSLAVLGTVSLVYFVVRQLRTHAPLLDLRVLANGRYVVTLLISSIITISLYSGAFLIPLFLQEIQGVTPLKTGLILLPASLAMALLMPLVGRMYGTLGPSTLMTTGVLLIAGGTYALSHLTPDVSHTYVLMWMLVRNVGISLSIMPASNAGMEQLSRELSGHASSISSWLRNVFGAFSIAIFTSLLSSFAAREAQVLAREGMTERRDIELLSFVTGINHVYLVATVIALVAVPLSLMVRKHVSGLQASRGAR